MPIAFTIVDSCTSFIATVVQDHAGNPNMNELNSSVGDWVASSIINPYPVGLSRVAIKSCPASHDSVSRSGSHASTASISE